MKWLIGSIALLGLLGGAISAQEAAWYVGPSFGVDCSGHDWWCPISLDKAIALRLFEGNSRRIEFRAGWYALPQGLVINGTGTNERSRLIVSAYKGESVTLDGLAISPDMLTPKELVRISGAYVTVQGLRLVNSRAYNLEVRGSRMVNIVGNYLGCNVSNDSLKVDGGAKDINVINNTFTCWDSQAMDITQVQRVLVQHNTLFSSKGIRANAIGVKNEAKEVRIYDNTIRDTGWVALGGTSSSHAEPYEAVSVTFARNHLTDIHGMAVEVFSCDGCKVEDNYIDGAWGGVRYKGGESGCVGGCKPSRNNVVAGNRFRRLNGGPEREAVSDVMALMEPSEVGAALFSKNTYCGAAKFYQGSMLDWTGWTALMPSDRGSSVLTMEGCQ